MRSSQVSNIECTIHCHLGLRQVLYQTLSHTRPPPVAISSSSIMASPIIIQTRDPFSSRGIGDASIHTNLYTIDRIFALQLLAVVSAPISVMAAAITFYLFMRMRKRFRHRYQLATRPLSSCRQTYHVLIRLIICLISGDLCRATGYLIFGITAFTSVSTQTGSFVCHASGVITQWGTELSGSYGTFPTSKSLIKYQILQLSSSLSTVAFRC